ncbi:MAG: heavy metal translocating P-type ATPase [Gemmatimonadota bacterium]|nr:heavy metal translocating P-type ATPase [Gemmatimonadota bacterium]
MTSRWSVPVLPAAALGFLLVGLAARFIPDLAAWSLPVWTLGLWLTGGPLILRTLRGVWRGQLAADLVASLAILVAIILREPAAGLLVALMQSGGEELERRAERRASRAVRELEDAAPQVVHRLSAPGSVIDVAVAEVEIGDRLLVRPGEMLPCDGVVLDGESELDTARITGEPMPVAVAAGDRVQSGAINRHGALTIEASARPGESLYARIVELVRTAQASKAPLQRIADRWAVWFTPLTVAVCAVAWAVSGDPVRVLAVLVVATPCPLILATPVAIIGGINRAARQHIVIRHGGALEALASIDTVVFDKTGTLTIGQPEVTGLDPVGDLTADQLLRLAAAVEQGSGHSLAQTTVAAATRRGLKLPVVSQVVEAPGRGVRGEVEGRVVVVGTLSLLREQAPGAVAALELAQGSQRGLQAFVAEDGRAAGIISYADRVRPNAAEIVAGLPALGVRRILMLSGDQSANAATIGREVGIAEVSGDLLPEEKVSRIQALLQAGRTVLMVGDGTNDAPALSTAQVGVALAGHGGGIAAESADVVLLEDDLRGIPAALAIGRDTMRIARQSLGVGLGLSAIAMAVAAMGHIPPTTGALLQEGVDIAVILNALRATRGA